MKRDINLLPKKKASSGSSSKGIAVALAVLLLYLIVFGVAIKIPMDLVDAVKQANATLDNEILALQPQVQEYDNLVTELSQLQAEIDNKEEIVYSDKTLFSALEIIEQTCPSGIMILNFKNSVQTIELTAKAESDELVAQFMLELDRSGYFSSIQFAGTSPTDIVLYNEFGEPVNEEARSFSLVLIYGEAQATEEEAQADGGGQ